MIKDMEPTIDIDITGEVCPYPLVILKKEAAALNQGEILKALIDSKPSVSGTIPKFCQKNGFDLEVVEIVPGEQWEIYLLKK